MIVGRLKNDESGIAMALAVIMIALIGAMGAGLLVFVSADLGIVVESNQGQRAFEMADSGVKAAKRQLESEMRAEKYNDNSAMGDDSQWAKSKDGVTLRDLDGDGDDRDFVHVTIENMNANSFRIVSTGEYGPARRRIEAYFRTRNLSIPMAYFTGNAKNDSIDVQSTAVIENMSLFSKGSVTIESGAQFIGEDLLYGDWENDFNETARPTDAPGIGTTCYIIVGGRKNCDGSGPPGLGGSAAEFGLGTKSYDITGDGTRYPGPQFVASPSDPDNQTEDEITFPFDPATMDYEPDEEGLDPRMSYLKELAIEQGNYFCNDASDPDCVQNTAIVNNSGTDKKIVGWPGGSTYDTVVYIKYPTVIGGEPTLRKLLWQVPGECEVGDVKRGVLIVDGANLNVQGNTAPFSGVTLAHGGRAESNADTFDSLPGSCWEGPVSSRGETTIQGRAGFFLTGIDPSDVSGLGGVQLQSWREVYSAD